MEQVIDVSLVFRSTDADRSAIVDICIYRYEMEEI